MASHELLKFFFPNISFCTFIHALRSNVKYCVTGEEKIYTSHYVAAQGPSISFTGLPEYSSRHSFTLLLQLLGFVKAILNAIIEAGVLSFYIGWTKLGSSQSYPCSPTYTTLILWWIRFKREFTASEL